MSWKPGLTKIYIVSRTCENGPNELIGAWVSRRAAEKARAHAEATTVWSGWEVGQACVIEETELTYD